MGYKKEKSLKDVEHFVPRSHITGEKKKHLDWHDLSTIYVGMTNDEIRELLGLPKRKRPKVV